MPKTASLVFFYFGESSYVNKIAQEMVPLHRALTGYDRAILLRHEVDIGYGDAKIELSEKAEQEADLVDLPTKENLAKYLNKLGDGGYIVDLYIFSHGTNDCFRTSCGTYGDNTTVDPHLCVVWVKKPKVGEMVHGTKDGAHGTLFAVKRQRGTSQGYTRGTGLTVRAAKMVTGIDDF